MPPNYPYSGAMFGRLMYVSPSFHTSDSKTIKADIL